MGYLLTILRFNFRKIGYVTGGDFDDCFLSVIRKNKKAAFVIYGIVKEDYVFCKDDVIDFCAVDADLEFGVQTKNEPLKRFQLMFNDGKSCHINVLPCKENIVMKLLDKEEV